MQAMILAAGFGTRLRPLTDVLPKPAIPVANRPLIHYPLAKLQQAGVTRVAVNLHHHGEAIRKALADAPPGLEILTSEEPVILGTGGGLVRMRPLLGAGAFFLLNGDVLSAVDLKALLAHHRRLGGAATLVVRPRPPVSDFTPLRADESGRIVTFGRAEAPPEGAATECMYSGQAVLEPAVFEHLPSEGVSSLPSAFEAILEKGAVLGAFWDRGPWFDLGTPARYLEANGAVLRGAIGHPAGPAGCQSPRGVLTDPTARIDPTARLGPEVSIGAECQVGAFADLARVILWPGAIVPANAVLSDAIVTAKLTVKV